MSNNQESAPNMIQSQVKLQVLKDLTYPVMSSVTSLIGCSSKLPSEPSLATAGVQANNIPLKSRPIWRYFANFLKRFHLDTANPISTPADINVHLQETQGPDDHELSSSIPFREVVGCLMYAMVTTRLDIAFVVSRVAKFTSNPHNTHWTAVNRIFYSSQEPHHGYFLFWFHHSLLSQGLL